MKPTRLREVPVPKATLLIIITPVILFVFYVILVLTYHDSERATNIENADLDTMMHELEWRTDIDTFFISQVHPKQGLLKTKAYDIRVEAENRCYDTTWSKKKDKLVMVSAEDCYKGTENATSPPLDLTTPYEYYHKQR